LRLGERCGIVVAVSHGDRCPDGRELILACVSESRTFG
jgi:hypothetical protein